MRKDLSFPECKSLSLEERRILKAENPMIKLIPIY
jgi:hypothetical protein